MKTLLYFTLALSILATGVSLKTVAKTNENGGSNFLRAGSRRLEDTCDSIKTIICELQNTQTFCEMVTELEKTSTALSDRLSAGMPFTVFAPTNDAFLNITEQLAQLSDKETEEIILFHFNEGEVKTYDELECTMTLTSLTGDTSRTKCRRISPGVYNKHQRGGGNEKLEQFPKIESKSKEACDGIIHRLDHVMLPTVYKPFKELLPPKETAPPKETPPPRETPPPTTEDNPVIIDGPNPDNIVTTPPENPKDTTDPTENGGLTTTDDPSIEQEDKVDQGQQGSNTSDDQESKKKGIGALGINLIIFSTLLLCFVFVCMRR